MKRKQISLIRLYKLANQWVGSWGIKEENSLSMKRRFQVVVDYLQYVNDHKYDNLD